MSVVVEDERRGPEQTSGRRDPRRPRLRSRAHDVGRPSIVWAIPATLYFTIFALLPLGVVVWLSFTSWSGIGSPSSVGLSNWRSLVSDPVMRQSIWLMVLLTALGVVTQTPVSLLLGVWAAGRQRNRALLTALYFIPLLMSSAAVAIVWRALLDPNFGLPHQFPGLFGSGDLFGNAADAIGVLTFVGLWQWTPLYTLIFQGGARAIPTSLYEAAAIDGAGPARQFFTITLPQLRNTIITSMILMVIGGMTTFESILILTQGHPGNSTTTTAYYMYEEAFDNFSFGKASAIAVVLVVIATGIGIAISKWTGYDKMRSTLEGV
jgi:xylobiose transport system permease protein